MIRWLIAVSALVYFPSGALSAKPLDTWKNAFSPIWTATRTNKSVKQVSLYNTNGASIGDMHRKFLSLNKEKRDEKIEGLFYAKQSSTNNPFDQKSKHDIKCIRNICEIMFTTTISKNGKNQDVENDLRNITNNVAEKVNGRSTIASSYGGITNKYIFVISYVEWILN